MCPLPQRLVGCFFFFFRGLVSGDLRGGGRVRQALSNVKATNVISPALALLLSSRNSLRTETYLLCRITETLKGNVTFALFQIRLWRKIMAFI